MALAPGRRGTRKLRSRRTRHNIGTTSGYLKSGNLIDDTRKRHQQCCLVFDSVCVASRGSQVRTLSRPPYYRLLILLPYMWNLRPRCYVFQCPQYVRSTRVISKQIESDNCVRVSDDSAKAPLLLSTTSFLDNFRVGDNPPGSSDPDLGGSSVNKVFREYDTTDQM